MNKSIKIQIGGMSCNHCVEAVKKSLSVLMSVEVEKIEVGHAQIKYDTDQTTESQIKAAIIEEGYECAIV